MTDSLPFNFKIRRNSRVKNTRIVVKHNIVEVVAPPDIPEHRLNRFVHDKREWISRHLERFERSHSEDNLAPERYEQGAKIPFLGAFYILNLKTHNKAGIKIEFDREFTIWAPVLNQEKLTQNLIRYQLGNWMREYAIDLAQQLVTKHSALFQLQPRSIRIKEQKSRWGSCGIHNDINLNWVLILGPVEVFEYVVVHELCHIKHRNHSADFWSLVAAHCPDYKQQRKWLKDNGNTLMKGL